MPACFCILPAPAPRALALLQATGAEVSVYLPGEPVPEGGEPESELARFRQWAEENYGGGYPAMVWAEWEYAARGGKYSQGYAYAGGDKLDEVGWYGENSHGETKPVGLKLANELGICDMSGNVWEWCEDDYHDSYKGAPKDGSAWIDAPERGVIRVLRGGCFFYYAVYCRPANRGRLHPGLRYGVIGFRLASSEI